LAFIRSRNECASIPFPGYPQVLEGGFPFKRGARVSDIVVCLSIIALSVFFYVHTLSFPTVIGYEKMGPDFWPKLMLAGIVILALIVMIGSILEQRKGTSPKAESKERSNTVGAVVCAGILLLFIISISYIGFLLSAFLSMMVLAYALGERNKLLLLFFSFIMVAMIYLSFGKLLFVPMPRGVWIFRELSYYLY
jgi:putative tricarboxylic transport membrane protein